MRANMFTIYTPEELAKTGGGDMEQSPFIRISNCGCGLEGCHCSNGQWISLSTGKIGITVQLTPEEFETVRKAFRKPDVWVDL